MNHGLDYDSGKDLSIETCDRLRLARVKAGIEQEEMAEVLGVSSSTISNWETGRTTPKAAFIAAWARVTGFNMTSLLSDEDAANLLAKASKREKRPDPQSAGQAVSQLPRMDSNHQPCDLSTLTSSFSIRPRNMKAQKTGESVSRKSPIPEPLEQTNDAQGVSSTRRKTCHNLKTAGQTQEKGI